MLDDLPGVIDSQNSVPELGQADSVPVMVTYEPPEGRVTAFRPFLDNLRITRTYTIFFFRTLLPVPHRIIDTGRRKSGRERLSALRPRRLIRALLAEHNSPPNLGFAAALGLFLATLPLIGFHSVAIIYAATVFKVNRLMAFSVSHLCAPPVVPAVCLEVGYFARHGEWLKELNRDVLIYQIDQRFIDYILGTIIVSPVLAVVGGLVIYAVASYLSGRNRP